jgi:hypothetical protein
LRTFFEKNAKSMRYGTQSAIFEIAALFADFGRMPGFGRTRHPVFRVSF